MGQLEITLRKWQSKFFKNMKRFNVLLVHRRAGKSYCTVLKLINAAMECTKPRPQFAYIAPESDQADKIIWGYIKDMLKTCPFAEIRETKKEVFFKHNGASIDIIGLKNLSAIRGRYFDGIVVDEYSDAPRSAFDEVLAPALADRQGWAILMGTIKGQCLLHQTYLKALTDDSGLWHAADLKWYDTNALPESEIEILRSVMTNDKFRQEMENDPYANHSDKYYLELMHRAFEQGRVGNFTYNMKYPVYTGWDLGTDMTAIWFFQRIGNENIFIDYWQKEQIHISQAIQVILNKGYIYKAHFLPWDADHKSTSSEASCIAQLRVHTNNAILLDRTSRNISIRTAQNAMVNCKFNGDACAEGILALKNYRAKTDKKTGLVLEDHVHDQYSHGADAFRYSIQGIGIRTFRNAEVKEIQFDNNYNYLDVFSPMTT